MTLQFAKALWPLIALTFGVTASAQTGSCAQYGVIQAIGLSPTELTLQVLVFNSSREQKSLVLPVSSQRDYRVGQRICVSPAPSK